MIYYTKYDSPLKTITIVEGEGKIIGLWFQGQTAALAGFKEEEKEERETPLLKQTEEWLDHYFLGEAPIMNLPLKTNGTPFQEKVWQVLSTIPYGSTMSYQEVGQRVIALTKQKRMSAQAIGQAVASNPISILIPCHRVLGKDGSLTGYAGGVQRKESLLRLEGTI